MFLDSKNTLDLVQNEKGVFLKMSVSPTRELIFQGFEDWKIVSSMWKIEGEKW